MGDLLQEDALVIYDIIMTSENQELIDATKQALKCAAESSMGMYAMASSWNGTKIPPVVLSEIKEQYGVEDLYDRNLLSNGGDWIELNVLAGALPNDLVMTHFHFDMEAKASEYGIDLNVVRELLRTHIVRFQKDERYGDEEVVFSKNFDFDANFDVMSKILGLGIGAERDGEYIIMGKLVCQNIKKLMEDDRIFLEKFNFLGGV